MKIFTSAPGKLMLFGEHAVVHNQPCLVTAVDLRVHVSLETIDRPVISIETPHLNILGDTISIPIDELWNNKSRNPQISFILASIQRVMIKYGIQKGLRIITSGPINSYGLGSSSAVTVATIFALLSMFDIPFDNQELFDISFGAVLDVQKLGSGFDVASAIYGRTLFYQLSKKPEILNLDEIPIIIGYSGEKVSTIDLVQEVDTLKREYPEIIDHIFNAIGKITIRARNEILKKEWRTVGKLANINQGLLDSLGVSTARLNEPIMAARRSGAFGAKLSGAGGGDCMFAIFDKESKSIITEAIERCGGKVLHLGINAEGVRLESRFA